VTVIGRRAVTFRQTPEQFGLTDVTTACMTTGVAPFTCQAADEFLYWDGIHPTKACTTSWRRKLHRR